MKSIYSPTHSLVNLSNTLLVHFQVEPFHPPIPSLLKRLNGKKKIAVLLFDGMGQTIIQRHLSRWGWLRKRRWGSITSTFPSTTAAATNAFLSGRYPIEIGWLGWAHYFPEHDAILELFTGKNYLNQQPFLSAAEVQKDITYETIFERIQQRHSNLNISQVWPDIKPGGAPTIEVWWSQLDQLLSQTKAGLTYGYWLEPDKSIHALGVGHASVRTLIRQLELDLKVMSEKHPDTTFIVLADHGLVDVTFLNIQAHPDLYSLMMRSFAFEPRAATFFVQPNKTQQFSTLFHRYYGRHFLLLSKEEVLTHHIYGLGIPHRKIKDFLGDFVAISRSKYAFSHGTPQDTMPLKMKAHHAGMTSKELRIDVMVIDR
jgi:predicted AlkP superfamily pyrophosphatase or phosphodiesterase